MDFNNQALNLLVEAAFYVIHNRITPNIHHENTLWRVGIVHNTRFMRLPNKHKQTGTKNVTDTNK